MNAIEMQYAFEKRAGLMNNFTPARLHTQQIQDYLNLAQDLELKDIYSKNVGRPATKFEFTEKIRREIGNLIKSLTVTVFDSSSPERHGNGVFVTLPENYLYGIEERAIINTGGNTSTVKVMPITHDEYLEDIENPFLWPYEGLIWRLDYGMTGATGAKRHELILGDDETIESYKVRYIRRPQKIILHPENSQDCELDDSTHERIVNRAVSMAASTNKEEEQMSN